MDRRLIWSEHVPYAVVTSERVLGSLHESSIELVVAVHPHQVAELPDLLRACHTFGVSVRIWPLLEDGDGRWLSGWTVDAYEPHLRNVLRVMGTVGRSSDVIFDLEPPIDRVRDSLGRLPSASWVLATLDHARARHRVGELISLVRAHGHTVSAVVPPFLMWDRDERGGIARSLGTPVFGLDFDYTWVMAYTSLLEGYSRGLLRRSDSRWLLANWSRAAKRRFGDKAGIALGVVGGGALGDERPYRDVSELQDDLAIANASGIGNVALFGLSGVLARESDAWFKAFRQPELASPLPTPTKRTRAITGLGRTLARLR